MEFQPIAVIPDVSMYQDSNLTPQKIDFVKMKAAGVVGVIIRAGQNTWEDPDFKDYWKAAKEAGLLRGSYWLLDSRSSPDSQARKWRSLFGDDLPELGIWADLEEQYDGPYRFETHRRQFMEESSIVFPNLILGVYSASWWWNGENMSSDIFWAKYPLWVSGPAESPDNVVLPKPWRDANKKAVLWQFTYKGDGPKYGVESLNIDLNYTSPEFHNLFSIEQPTEGEPTMKTYILKVLVSYLNGRLTPSSTSMLIYPAGATYATTGFRFGDILEADAVSNNWYRITSCLRNGSPITIPAVVWAYAGAANGYLELLESYEDEPEPVEQTIPPVLYIATKADFSDAVRYERS